MNSEIKQNESQMGKMQGLFWKPVKNMDMLKVLIPICFIGSKDMGVGSDGYFGIETACRNHYERSVLLDVWQGRTAFFAETFYMSACLVIEGFDQVLSRKPMQGSRRSK
jgi:hypothetical protein